MLRRAESATSGADQAHIVAGPPAAASSTATWSENVDVIDLGGRGGAFDIDRDRQDPTKTYLKVAIGMAVVDALSLVGALVVAYLLWWRTIDIPPDYIPVLLFGPVVWIAVFRAYGLYATQHLSAWEEFRRSISACSIGVLLLILVSYWSRLSYSRGWVAFTWLFALLFVLGARRIWRTYLYRLKFDGRLALRTIIVGTSKQTGELIESLQEPGSGFAPVGVLATPGVAPPNGLPSAGNLSQLGAAVAANSVDCLFVDSRGVTEQEIVAITKIARQHGTHMHVTANLPDILTTRLTIQQIAQTMAVSVRPVRLTGTEATVKRAFDLCAASVVLVIAAPFMLLIALAIKASSRGATLYRQDRVTKGGQVFTMYKFRTMLGHSDSMLEEMPVDPTTPFFKGLGKEDPRLTRIGRTLRRLSLDELPQLFNVVRGNMSLVGPRPLPTDQVAANLEMLGPRHEVRSGMTGWWQIGGRSDLSPEESVKMDLFYIENWSLTLDLYILLKTFAQLVKGRGAY
jgi:exopolysaccharide biosynthesis polyprenyl glycosylphosphotransferase